MKLYEQLPEVDEDWREIADYTYKKWGERKLREYTSDLEKSIELMVSGKCHYKEIQVYRRVVRVKQCGHHYIFGLMRKDKPMLVLAILHERMKMIKRVRKRLKP